MSTALAPGSKAPQFSSTAVGGAYGAGKKASLSEFKGQTVILYFYPKDDTPGCTTQACELRDAWPQFDGKVVVFGVSIDPAESHTKFIEKFSLPFPLLADEDKSIVKAYGVWVEKSMYGKRYMGTERTTFVIGPDQKIQAVLPKIKPAEHVKELLAMLA